MSKQLYPCADTSCRYSGWVTVPGTYCKDCQREIDAVSMSIHDHHSDLEPNRDRQQNQSRWAHRHNRGTK